MLILLLTHLVVGLEAQESISGIVLDKFTKQPVPYAHVFGAKSKVGVYTKMDGEFVLPFMREFKRINISCIGYETQSFLAVNSIDSLFLNPLSIRLDVVEIISTKKIKIEKIGYFKKAIIPKARWTTYIPLNPNPNKGTSLISYFENNASIELSVVSYNCLIEVQDIDVEQVLIRLVIRTKGENALSGKILHNRDIIEIVDIKRRNLVTVNLEHYNITLPPEGVECEMKVLGLLNTSENFVGGSILFQMSKTKTTNIGSYLSHYGNNFIEKNDRGMFYNFASWIEVIKN